MPIRPGWPVWALTLVCCWPLQMELLLAKEQPFTYGPFDGEFPAGGEGLAKDLPGQAPTSISLGEPGWTLYGWVRLQGIAPGRSLIAGLGDPAAPASSYLASEDGRLMLWAGTHAAATGSSPMSAQAWHFIAATSDMSGSRLYADGAEIAHGAAISGDPFRLDARAAPVAGTLGTDRSAPGAAPTRPALQLAPRSALAPFAGKIAGLTYVTAAFDAKQIAALASARPSFDRINFESGSPTWPVQTRQMYGQVAPQPPRTLPKSASGFSKAVAKPASNEPALTASGPELWNIGGWRLAEAPKIKAGGAELSQTGGESVYKAVPWYVATVPGTVLTTLIDRGVYPEPDYGLNNLAIPESLNKQDYWYRTEFDAPASLEGRRTTLTFGGINFTAEVWLNGARLGEIRGAFVRGIFDVTNKLKAGARNAVAVRVSPPPHPGIPHEESLTAGVGENGGILALDGPTFIASEGWDWIPSVRDRNTGLWQGVTLSGSGIVTFGDPQVVTTLDSPANRRAEIEISIPLENNSNQAVEVDLRAAFDDVSVVHTRTIAPGESIVKLTPEQFPQLAVSNPRLWWPNGYGEPALHDLTLTVVTHGVAQADSDRKRVRFGIRQVTYELSLLDQSGQLRRVEVDLSKARARGERVVDVRHEALHKVPNGWAASLYPGAEQSAAIRELQDTRLTPHLVIKVNGVRIAARGGNWGTDDWRKRVSREKLEPYFRLHQLAHLNVIRNWVGQNTEEVFFELADEYGLMVLNDFWASTQDYQLEPQDVPLFLNNAADVIKRYRNHPSIVLWFGRNEGVPQPILNEGLDKLIAELDGTRYYTGSSNRVNLQNSGPYNYRAPASYFTEHARGFSVEVGTPSFPTLESFKRWIPERDRWPISDAWAYHDWHQSGNGDVKSFMTALETQLGAPTSLEDFERKAQLMNYDTHRAIFEGMNAKLWTANSGRLLWMTQPAWPSTMWQILSSDYDTHGSFYGVMKASEPVHVQMNLPDYGVVLVNNTTANLPGISVTARAFTLSNQVLVDRSEAVNAAANAVSSAFSLDLSAARGPVFVKLTARDGSGKLVSENFYWASPDVRLFRQLNELPRTSIVAQATSVREGKESKLRIKLRNAGNSVALGTKLTLFNADGTQILPAYFSDNYISLLPGEATEVVASFPSTAARGSTTLALRGWNIESKSTRVTPQNRN